MGRVSFKEWFGYLLFIFCVLNILVFNFLYVMVVFWLVGLKCLWSSGKDNFCFGRGGFGGEVVGKEREFELRLLIGLGERDVIYLCDFFVIF